MPVDRLCNGHIEAVEASKLTPLAVGASGGVARRSGRVFNLDAAWEIPAA